LKTVALVPIRSLHDAKRRLAEALTVEERRALVLHLWQRTHAALTGAATIDQVVVITPDPALIGFLARDGVHAIRQRGEGLNAGLDQARDALMGDGDALRLLVVLPDLPLVRASDIDMLVALSDPLTIVIASDRHGSGTNALLLPRPDAIPFSFGQNSLRRHEAAAIEHGFAIARYDAPGTALDLDTPDDLGSFQNAIMREREVREIGG
jgi:2-phospho-L-lactate/phosphoenolpyruvate guanylyltransferase